MEAMRTGGIEFVLVANEASGGIMADVCARITGVPGACHGTFGPYEKALLPSQVPLRQEGEAGLD
jgi:hypothetical protein